MKQNLKLKVYAEFKRALIRVRPIQEKIEDLINKQPLARKIIKLTTPLQEKALEKLKINLDRLKMAMGYVDKEIQDLEKQYKEDPKKVFQTTLAKAREIARVPKKFRKKKHSPVAPVHSAKADKRSAAHN